MGKMEAQLKVWDAKINELAAKADKAQGQARIDFHYRVDDLKAQCALARARLDDLRAAGDERQESFKVDLELAWNDLEAAIKKLGKNVGL
jgi:hypothetical protein